MMSYQYSLEMNTWLPHDFLKCVVKRINMPPRTADMAITQNEELLGEGDIADLHFHSIFLFPPGLKKTVS